MRGKIVFLLSILVLLFSCSKPDQLDYVKLSGKIKNKNRNLIFVYGEDFKHSVKVDEKGSFSETLSIPKNDIHLLIYGKERVYLYLEKGYDLHIYVDASKFNKTLTFSGKGSEENKFLAKKYILKKEIIGEDFQSFFSKEEKEFENILEEYKSKAYKLLDNYQSLSENFKQIETNNIHFEKLNFLIMYETMRAFYTADNHFTVSEEFLKSISEEKLDNVDIYDKSIEYRKFVNNVFYKEILETLGHDKQSVIDEIIAIDHHPMRNLLAKTLLSHLDIDPYGKEDLFNAIMKISKDDKINESLQKRYYYKAVLLAKGKRSPAFSYKNYKGDSTSMSDFKGKYLYIDIWATWCRPCIYEIPFLKKLKREFRGKNIEFISISVDPPNNYDLWKKMIKERQLSGVQLFSGESFNSKFIRDYAIDGIPRFIIIDPQGYIVKANANRPSQKELKLELERLILN